MDLVTTIPVRMNTAESVPQLLTEVRERISRRAYDNFVGRGAVHGHDIRDWLEAERELIVKPDVDVRFHGEDIFVEMVLLRTQQSYMLRDFNPDYDGLRRE
jgi:hypothetical protein